MRVLMLHRPSGLPGGDDVAVSGYAAALHRIGYEVDERPANWLNDLSEYDVVHLWSACSPDWGLPAAQEVKRQGKPLVITPNWWSRRARLDYFGMGDDVAPGYTESVGEVLRLADVLFVCTMSEAAECWKLAPRQTVINVGHGCDLIARDLDGGIEEQVICLGRIERHKNQVNLALACRELGMPLLLLGSIANEYYARQAQALGAALGGPINHDDAMSLLAHSRVHALPSFSETPGLANMEASRLGVPGVMGNIGAEIEFFGAGGVYCDPRDYRDIAEAIMLAWDRPREPWADMPSWDAVAQRARHWLETKR